MGAVGLLTQQMLSLRLPGVCSASGPPRGGEGCTAAALRPPRAGARACLVGPSVVPLERSRSSLRCLRPSGGVVSLNPGVLLGSPPRWCVCVSREWALLGGGRGGRRGVPVPLVVEADGSSRPCRGRDAGSALAPAAQTLLCWCSAYLYRRPLPPQLRTGGSWSASVGPKERDDPGEGRRALGEKAFSSDPRGSLGVSDPPAAAPPECAVAAVAAAKSAWAEHPAPAPPLWGRWGAGAPAPRWGRVPLVAYRGPRLPPSSWGRVPLGPAGRPGRWGGTGACVRRVCARSAPAVW